MSADDNVIEGIYNLDHKIIGVQFHMENRGVSGDLPKQIMQKFKEL